MENYILEIETGKYMTEDMWDFNYNYSTIGNCKVINKENKFYLVNENNETISTLTESQYYDGKFFRK